MSPLRCRVAYGGAPLVEQDHKQVSMQREKVFQMKGWAGLYINRSIHLSIDRYVYIFTGHDM